MEGLLILALLWAGITGGPAPAAEPIALPDVVMVELVSLRYRPVQPWATPSGEGYLWLEVEPPSSPARPVERLGPPIRAVLPGVGVHPWPFRLAGDGQWHAPIPTPYRASPDSPPPGSVARLARPEWPGRMRLRVALRWQEQWYWAAGGEWSLGRGEQGRTLRFDVPGGIVEAYLVARG